MVNTVKTLLSVGLGGALGAILRISMRPLALRFFPLFPQMGTLLVNIIGCFCIGFFAAIFDSISRSSPVGSMLVFKVIRNILNTFRQAFPGGRR